MGSIEDIQFPNIHSLQCNNTSTSQNFWDIVTYLSM